MSLLSGPWKALLYAAPAAAASGAIGTPVVVTSGDSGGTSVGSITMTSNTVPAGKTLVVIAVGQDPSTAIIADDAGNTWSSLGLVQTGSGPVVNHTVFVCYNSLAISSGNTVTVTIQVTNRRTCWLFFYVDMGGGTPALDFQRPVTTGFGGANYSDTTPTLATADEFLFVPTVVQSAGIGSSVATSGFTDFVGATGIGSGSSNPRLHVSWKITSATTAVTVAPVLSDNTKDHEFATVALRK